MTETAQINNAIRLTTKLTFPPGTVKEYVTAFLEIFKYSAVTVNMGIRSGSTPFEPQE